MSSTIYLKVDRISEDHANKKHKILARTANHKGKHDSAARRLTLGGKLDINRASVSDWRLIPGIGRRTAQLIVEYRHRNGDFKTVDEMRKVKGIGKKTIERLKNWVQ